MADDDLRMMLQVGIGIRDTWHASEDGQVRAAGLVDHQEQGGQQADDHPLQHIDQHHPCKGEHRQPELCPRYQPDPLQFA